MMMMTTMIIMITIMMMMMFKMFAVIESRGYSGCGGRTNVIWSDVTPVVEPYDVGHHRHYDYDLMMILLTKMTPAVQPYDAFQKYRSH